MVFSTHLLVDYDGGRLPRLRRQLDPGHRRVDQAARATVAVARHLPNGNRRAGTGRMDSGFLINFKFNMSSKF